MTDKLLTDAAINGALSRAAKSGKDEWLADSNGRGDGRLSLRARPFGGFWVFSYAPSPRKFDRLEFGRYVTPRAADTAGAAYTLRQAREQCARFAELLKNPSTRNVRAHLAEIAAQAEARRRAEEDQREREALAARLAANFTLERLLTVYVDHLRRHGKKSADAADRALRLHIVAAHPELAKASAASLRTSDAAHIIRKLIEAGKGRTAGIVRSYARAAYALAMSAVVNSDAPADMIGFNVENNPFANVSGTTKYIRARNRTLSDSELRALLPRLRAYPSLGALAVLAALYAGGQRPEQLLEARYADWDASAGTLRLTDRKGRRIEPRVHFIPLASEGRAMFRKIAEASAAFYSAEENRGEFIAAGRTYLFPTRKTRKSKQAIGRLEVTIASKVVTQVSRVSARFEN
jgi:hypothetical protein